MEAYDYPKPMYDEISDFVNLLVAYRKAARGKRYRDVVADFDYQMEGQLLRLRDELRAQTYQPGNYRRYRIRDPKPRVISAAPFRDRVVHHALCNVLEPIFERRFIADSYASRPFKGIHKALDRCTYFARRYPYVLKCDIVQFFPSVDLDILSHRILSRVIQDGRVLRLINKILLNGAGELRDEYRLVLFPGDDPLIAASRPRGLPIGNQTSQFWANCYLNVLDQFVKNELRCPAYVRYVDDFLLFARDKQRLHRWKKALIEFLGRTLRLTLHESEAVVTPVTSGIPFLGFRVYPTHRRLRRRNGVAFARRFRSMNTRWKSGKMTLPEMNTRIRSWIAHVKHGDTWRLRASLFAPIAREQVDHG